MLNKTKKLDDMFKVKIILRSKGRKFALVDSNVISAPLPEDFGIDLSSEYDSPFEQSSDTIDKLTQLQFKGSSFAQYFGVPRFLALNQLIWKGSSNPEISLDLNFVAETSGKIEVYNPVVSLQMLVLPEVSSKEAKRKRIQLLRSRQTESKENKDPDKLQSEDVGLLTKAVSNIPTVDPPWLGNAVDVHIGKNFRYTDVVFTNISARFSGTLDSEGYPISADVSIRFSKRYLLLRSDIAKQHRIPSKIVKR